MQNTKASVNKTIRAAISSILSEVNITSLPYRPWKKKTEYPSVKWHIIGSRPPTLRNNMMWKMKTDFLLGIFTNEYQGALASNIQDKLLIQLGFDMNNALYETYIDKLDYVNKVANNNELIKLDNMHIWLEKIEDGPIIEPSETHLQLFLNVYHN